MFRIFRTIRQQLMSENRSNNYLFYALGEVLLVVVGILIALGINNWNELRKKKISANEQLVTIAQNITEDLMQLEDLNKNMDTVAMYADAMIRQFKTLAPVDQNTPLYIVCMINEYNLNPSKSGIETLNNSGDIAFVEPQLQTQILRYYTLLDHIRSREEISNTFIKNQYEPYFFNNYNSIANKDTPWLAFKSFYEDDPRPTPEFNDQKFLKDKQLEALTFARAFQSRNQKSLYVEVIKLAKELLQSLEEN